MVDKTSREELAREVLAREHGAQSVAGYVSVPYAVAAMLAFSDRERTDTGEEGEAGQGGAEQHFPAVTEIEFPRATGYWQRETDPSEPTEYRHNQPADTGGDQAGEVETVTRALFEARNWRGSWDKASEAERDAWRRDTAIALSALSPSPRGRELVEALHDAINSPKGVVPASAEGFYDAKRAALGDGE